MSAFGIILLTIFFNFELGTCLDCSISSRVLPVASKTHQMIYSSSSDRVYFFPPYSTDIYRWDHVSTTNTNPLFHRITTPTAPVFSAHSNNAVIIENKIYFVGMYFGNTNLWEDMHVFDTSTDTWDTNTLPDVPNPSYGGCLATNNTHILMVGGRLPGNDFSNKLQIYAVQTQQWTTEDITLSPIHQGWGYQSCQMINNKLYVFGGDVATPTGETAACYKYDPEQTPKWSHIATKSVATTGSASSYRAADNTIFIVGGATQGPHETAVIDIFDVTTEQIITSPTQAFMTHALYSLSSLILNDRLYIFGGWSGERDTNNICDCRDEIEQCEFNVTPAPTYAALVIENCDGSDASVYKAKVLNVPSYTSVDWVQMRDSNGNSVWQTVNTPNAATGCYEWSASNGVDFMLPLDIKVRSTDGVKIKTMDIINSWDAGVQSQMKDNFDPSPAPALTNNKLKNQPLITKSNDGKNRLFTDEIIILSSVCVVVLVVICMAIICLRKRIFGNKNKENDATTIKNECEMENMENEVENCNEICEISVSNDTQKTAENCFV